MPTDRVKIAVYNTEVEAGMARGRLEEAGIRAMVSSDDCGGMEPQLQWIRGVRLFVNPEDEERAREVLGLGAATDPAADAG